MRKRRLHRLDLVYTCQNDTLLEITCRDSYVDSLVHTLLDILLLLLLLLLLLFFFFFFLPSGCQKDWICPICLQRLSADDTRRQCVIEYCIFL